MFESTLMQKIESDLKKDSAFKEKIDPVLDAIVFWERSEILRNKDRREGYESGYKIGFEKGLHWKLPGEQLKRFSNYVLENGIESEKEFYSKFLQLCKEYGVGITYNPEIGGLVFYHL